jgi:hypothetical protein
MPGLHGAAARASLRLACLAASIVLPADASAHGFAGKRFFPATLATEDPFVADELSLPTIASRRLAGNAESPPTRETEFAVDASKRITDNLGIGLGATYMSLAPSGGERQHGFDNVEASLKYQVYRSDEHEALLSVGVDWDIGGSGTKRVGAESFSTLTPTVFFAKGFGDLPDAWQYLRPFAVTGLVGCGIPTRSSTTTFDDEGEAEVERHPHVLRWGLALQYSVQYLQSFVQDVGMKAPFNRMVGVVEFPMETPLDRGGGGTTGTVNPGVIWAGQNVQLAVEAVVPVNRRTGGSVGWIAQLHFFLDDLFPQSIGKPLFK